MKVEELTDEALFAQALDVINRALRSSRGRFPYQQILEASEKVLGDEPIAVGISKEPGGEPHDFYTVRLAKGRFQMVGRGKRGDPSLSWNLDRGYLRSVVEDPERYVESPEKLDLDWIKHRLGID